MTQRNATQSRPLAALGKRMLQGAGIALIPITLFLASAGAADPSWSKLWMMKPLITVPVAGAFGGVWFYFLAHLRYPGGWQKAVALVLGVAGYLVAVWLGIVAGLDGTYWD